MAVFSIIGLGITIGASTSALFFVTTRRIANREGYVTRDFYEAFKANIKRATALWLILVAVVLLIWFNINNMQHIGGRMAFIILPAQIIILFEITIMSIYAFPMAARFDMGVRQIIKTCFYIANRHLLTSITCLLLLVAAYFSFFIAPPIALFVAPGLYATLTAYMIMRIFKKYRPEMDKDPVLEIQEIEAEMAAERRRRSIGYMEGGGEAEEVEEEVDFWTSVARENEPSWAKSSSGGEPDTSEPEEASTNGGKTDEPITAGAGGPKSTDTDDEARPESTDTDDVKSVAADTSADSQQNTKPEPPRKASAVDFWASVDQNRKDEEVDIWESIRRGSPTDTDMNTSNKAAKPANPYKTD